MKREEIIIAKTVLDATTEAYEKFSADGDVTVDIEVIEKEKKGFLGIGATPAKIKVIIDDGVEEKPTPKAEPRRNENKKEKNPKTVEKKADKPKKDTPKKEKPAVKETAAVSQERPEKKYEPVTDVEMGFAVEFVETVLHDLEVEAKAVSVKGEDGNYSGITIEGTNTGILIGHHGETLDAIQYLANLSASRRSPTPNREFLKLTVDVENYRTKREETIRNLARRMADKAVKYKRNFVLEPMKPYERRLIHSELQGVENISTHSVGSDDNRKVVITYEGADKVEHDRRRNRRGGGRGERKNKGYFLNNNETQPQDNSEAKEGSGPSASSYVMFDNTVPRTFEGWGKDTDGE